MNKLYFGVALVSLLASAPAMAQAGPSLGSQPNLPTSPLRFGPGAVNSASTAQAQGSGIAGAGTSGPAGVDVGLAYNGNRINGFATPTPSSGQGVSFNN